MISRLPYGKVLRAIGLFAPVAELSKNATQDLKTGRLLRFTANEKTPKRGACPAAICRRPGPLDRSPPAPGQWPGRPDPGFPWADPGPRRDPDGKGRRPGPLDRSPPAPGQRPGRPDPGFSWADPGPRWDTDGNGRRPGPLDRSPPAPGQWPGRPDPGFSWADPGPRRDPDGNGRRPGPLDRSPPAPWANDST